MTIFENIGEKMPNLMENKDDKVAVEAKNYLSKLINLENINFKTLKEELSKIKDSRVLKRVMKGLAIGTSAFLLNASNGNAQELKYTKNSDGTINVFKENVKQKVREHGKETVTITKIFKEDIGKAVEKKSDTTLEKNIDTTLTIEPNKFVDDKNINNKNSEIQIDGVKYEKMKQAPDPKLVKPNGDYRKLGTDWYQKVLEKKDVQRGSFIEVDGVKYQKMSQAPDPSLIKPRGDYRKLGNNWYQKISHEIYDNKDTVKKQNIINIDGSKYVSCDVAPTREMINTGDYRKIGQVWYTKYKL